MTSDAMDFKFPTKIEVDTPHGFAVNIPDQWVNGQPVSAFANNHAGARLYHERRIPDAQLARPDRTIQWIEKHRENTVKRMISAVFDLSRCIDKPASKDRKRFDLTNPKHEKLVDVEVVCRLIFDEVIMRCVYGYRREAMQSSQRPAVGDVHVTCCTRVENIINALRVSKAICRNVVLEEKRRLMLVHMPLASLKMKQRNQAQEARKARRVAKAAAECATFSVDINVRFRYGNWTGTLN